MCSRYRLLRARDSKASKIQPGVLDEKYYKNIKKSVLMLKMRWYLAMDLTQQTGQGLTAHQKNVPSNNSSLKISYFLFSAISNRQKTTSAATMHRAKTWGGYIKPTTRAPSVTMPAMM